MTTPAKNKDVLLITLLGIAHGVSHFFHLVIPPLYPWLMPTFDLNFAQVGLVMTIFFIVSALGQAASGFLVDRFGAKRCLIAGTAALMLSGVALALAQGYSWLFVSTILAGLGNSVFHPADYSIINRSISEERIPYAFSIHAVVGNVGWAVAPVLMVGVAMLFDWRAAAWSSALIGLGVLVLLMVYQREFDVEDSEEEVAKEKAQEKKSGSFGFLTHLSVWLCFFFFFFTCVAYGILQNFAPSIFKATYNLSLETATAGLTAYIVGSATGILSGGWVAKRFPRTDYVIASSLTFAAFMACLLATQWVPGWMVLPLMTMMGFGVGIATPSRDMLIRQTTMVKFGKNTFGRVYGFTYCGMDVGQTMAPVIAGPLLDAGQFTMALILVAVFQSGAVLTALGVGRQK
ncbi:MAG: MFS transporter [Burkholderiaceae bacterium]|nr:MFS transporter [Burkholderiaceae bacterium]